MRSKEQPKPRPSPLISNHGSRVSNCRKIVEHRSPRLDERLAVWMDLNARGHWPVYLVPVTTGFSIVGDELFPEDARVVDASACPASREAELDGLPAFEVDVRRYSGVFLRWTYGPKLGVCLAKCAPPPWWKGDSHGRPQISFKIQRIAF
ncbi:hypothetical protein HDK64DRAFT_250809 [Phyllosticta capitalensis]